MDNYTGVSSFKVEKNIRVPRQWFGMALFSVLFFAVFSAQSNDEVDHLNVVVQDLAQESKVTLCRHLEQ